MTSPIRGMPAVLTGLRVLDLSRILAGPFCAQLLGDLGAEVIKIERPGVGDDTRTWGPPFHPTGVSAYYLSCNRNKRAISLDLGQSRGREIFHTLLRQSDVVLENYLPESAEKLGITPKQIFEIAPQAIICSISGFGRTGDWRDVPGYDFAIQAMSGLMSITGPVEGMPFKVGVALTDVLTGIYASTAILACLIARGRSGRGYAIDLSLLDCAVASQVNVVQAYLARVQAALPPAEAVPARQGNAHLQIVPYQLFATADGWLVLAVGNDRQWENFARTCMPEVAGDPRFSTNPARVLHREILVPLIEACLLRYPTQKWCSWLSELAVPHAPLWTYAELFAQPQMETRGMRMTIQDSEGRPIDLIGSPFHIVPESPGDAQVTHRAPPTPGQHTQEILEQLCGLNAESIEALRREGVIA